MIKRQILRDFRRSSRNSRWNADAHLRAHERSANVDDEAILRVDICQLAANKPIEDFYSSAKCLSSRAFLFGVFDGHGGASCSRYISSNLYPYICSSVLKKHEVENLSPENRIQWLFNSSGNKQNTFVEGTEENVAKYHKKFVKNQELYQGTVRKALETAFEACDEDLSKQAFPLPNGSIDRLKVEVAAAGSCATLAHIRNRHLHVANAGDAGAVLGIVNSNGSVTARQLSRPHCIENADEVHRLRSAHPPSELNTVLRAGRLLGELIPLRAFGDIRFKWPLQLQKVVLEPLGDPPPHALHTPPYLTATPEVFYHKLTPNDKFLVLATDGLWEWLDPDTVVRLVHDHTLGTMTLQSYQPKPGTTLKQVCDELAERAKGEAMAKKPIDDNCATHIIRHALGGVSGGTTKQYERLIDILQIPPGRARNYRDDISVIVIHFNEKFLSSLEHDDEEVH